MAYSNTSPYYRTGVNVNRQLETLTPRRISASAGDQILTINTTYEYRPDLLANDLYDNPKLWWVFAQRNPNQLQDPLFDFQTGTTIYLPQLPTLKTVLGI